jgi:microcystin-dependent protein
MASPYIGEIRMFAGNFAPAGWALCDGSPLQISQNPALFGLIGTTYGGNGTTQFNLPNLQSRVPIHQGIGLFRDAYVLGQAEGLENVTLTGGQVAAHNHGLQASSAGAASASPANALPGPSTSTGQPGTLQYGPGTGSPTTLAPASITSNSGGGPHPNIQPFLCISFIISLYGAVPTPA